MDNDNKYIHDAYASSLERTIKRLWISSLVFFVAFVVAIGTLIYFVSNTNCEVTTTVTQELDSDNGGDAIINDGVHINGKSETNCNYN